MIFSNFQLPISNFQGVAGPGDAARTFQVRESVITACVFDPFPRSSSPRRTRWGRSRCGSRFRRNSSPIYDPFVLLHHAPPKDFGGDTGVSWHPHRGFAPVTFIFKGGLRHRDTQGNDATVHAGGTQWMHAGSGLLHDETPLPGEAEFIQLWINSPARHKMDPPSYHPLTPEATPASVSPDRLVTLTRGGR